MFVKVVCGVNSVDFNILFIFANKSKLNCYKNPLENLIEKTYYIQKTKHLDPSRKRIATQLTKNSELKQEERSSKTFGAIDCKNLVLLAVSKHKCFFVFGLFD